MKTRFEDELTCPKRTIFDFCFVFSAVEQSFAVICENLFSAFVFHFCGCLSALPGRGAWNVEGGTEEGRGSRGAGEEELEGKPQKCKNFHQFSASQHVVTRLVTPSSTRRNSWEVISREICKTSSYFSGNSHTRNCR